LRFSTSLCSSEGGLEMDKFDLTPCPHVEHQHFNDTELLCDIQECNTCPMRFKYFQEKFKAKIKEA
jgi:hypothetical protein